MAVGSEEKKKRLEHSQMNRKSSSQARKSAKAKAPKSGKGTWTEWIR